MIKASLLRDKNELNKIEERPGYYTWWASGKELDFILQKLNLSYSDLEFVLEWKDYAYCIYVGIAEKGSLRSRLNWHINDAHTPSRVENGTLSTLRQTIASIVAGDQYDKNATDEFIDKLFVEWVYSDNPIKSQAAKTELHEIEQKLMKRYLRILNIQGNHHPYSVLTKDKLKTLRKQSRTRKS